MLSDAFINDALLFAFYLIGIFAFLSLGCVFERVWCWIADRRIKKTLPRTLVNIDLKDL